MSLEEFNVNPTHHSNSYLKNTMSLEVFDEDLTMMGMESTNHNWWALDIDPKFPRFNSSDLAFDTTVFGLQSLQVSSSSTSSSTDCRFNQDFPPTFNSPNLPFDTPPAFGFEQSSHPSHLDNGLSMDFTSIVPNNNPLFSVPSWLL